MRGARETAAAPGAVGALARFAARRPIAVAVLAATTVFLGWLALDNLAVDLLPDVESPTVMVSLRSGERPPLEMERLYGERLEQRLFAVRGVRRVEQTARAGRLVARVVFDWDVGPDQALVDVQRAVQPLAADPEVDELFVRRFDPRRAPVLTLGLVAPEGHPDLAELRRLARRRVAPALERLEGVAEVRVLGGREREVRVIVDPYRLEAHGIPLSELRERLRASNFDIAAGTLEESRRIYLVRGLSRFRRPEDVAAVVVRYQTTEDGRRQAVRVADVARVEELPRQPHHLVLVDGREGVSLACYKEAGANTVLVSRTLRAALEGLARDLPGIEVRIVADEAALVEEAIADLEWAALAGIALAVAVLAFFLRSFVPTLVVGAAVPVSLFGALFLLYLADHSLNLMTLGGLALGAGMLVDNAIVVVEAVYRRRAAGDAPAAAAVGGTAEVGGAIVCSTLTTCVVFAPVIFVSGLAARLVEGLAFSVVVSLLASLVVAVLWIPALAGLMLGEGPVQPVDPGQARIARWVRALVARPAAVVGAAVSLAVGSGFLLARLGTEFLPPADPRQFSVRLVGPPGQRVEATAAVVRAVEAILRHAAAQDIAVVLAEVGRLPEDDRVVEEEPSEEHTARLFVRLRRQGRTASEVVAAAAAAVAQLPELEASWEVGVSALARAVGRSGPPLAVEISGESLADLRAAATALRERLAAEPALWNVRTSFEGGPPELHLRVRPVLAQAHGVQVADVAAAVAAALQGSEATSLVLGDEEEPVVVALPRVERVEALARQTLRGPAGTRFALGEVATFETVEGAREILRRDQRRVARVSARVAPGYRYPEARAAMQAALESWSPPPGLGASLAGEEEERAETFAQLRTAGVLAMVLLFFVLAGSFESLVHPFTVLAAVPLALVGVGPALALGGAPVGVMAMLGLIVLAGIAVNDAILLVDAARRLQANGLATEEALARAAAERLRPILMTSATTVLALVPLALGTSEAARLRSPLAVTIIAGMVTSTVGSLTVIPCLYALLERLRPQRNAPPADRSAP